MTQQATEPQPFRLITVREACDQLGCGRTKFYELCQQGVFSVFNLNSGAPRGPVRKGQQRPAIRVEQAEIDAYKASIKVPATA
jgi:predicted DNA-binding transcriptional regulator AlpA